VKRRSPLKRGAPPKRTGWIRRSRRRRVEVVSTIWRRDLGACAVCPVEGGVCSGPVQGHHCVDVAKLRSLGLISSLMDLRNRLPVCEHRHEQHTTRYKPIPRELLPGAVFEFADELGLGWWLDKHYPAEVAA
jgi:hypothetical protein